MNKLDEIIERVRNLAPELQDELLVMLKEWQLGKKREFQRLSTNTEVDVAVSDRVIQTDIRDISASGAFINASGKFAPDQDVRVVFTIPGFEKPFKLQGKIVRVEANGIAIKFEDITPYFKTILDDAIWKNRNSSE